MVCSFGCYRCFFLIRFDWSAQSDGAVDSYDLDVLGVSGSWSSLTMARRISCVILRSDDLFD